MKRLRYYLFCIKWLWVNNTWKSTRQKYKALDKAWEAHSREVHTHE